MQIQYTIKQSKEQSAIDACKWNRPIPLNTDGSPQFTDIQWVSESAKLDMKDKIMAYKKWQAEQSLNNEDLFN